MGGREQAQASLSASLAPSPLRLALGFAASSSSRIHPLLGTRTRYDQRPPFTIMDSPTCRTDPARALIQQTFSSLSRFSLSRARPQSTYHYVPRTLTRPRSDAYTSLPLRSLSAWLGSGKGSMGVRTALGTHTVGQSISGLVSLLQRITTHHTVRISLRACWDAELLQWHACDTKQAVYMKARAGVATRDRRETSGILRGRLSDGVAYIKT